MILQRQNALQSAYCPSRIRDCHRFARPIPSLHSNRSVSRRAPPIGVSSTSSIPGVDDSFRALDVAIIGGGPAGLATALALHKVNPSLRLKVFEACPEYTAQGAGVGLYSNGNNALRALDLQVLHRVISSAVYPAMSLDYSDETGERMPWQYPNDTKGALERGAFVGGVIPWNSIRTALFASLPEGIVEFGCKVTGCSGPGVVDEVSSTEPASGHGGDGSTESDARYTIHVTRSSTCEPGSNGLQEVLATARYVIAADGYFSKIRRTVGDGQAPVFTNTVRWLGVVTQADLEAGRVPIPAALDPQRNPEAMLCFHSYKPTSREAPCKSLPERTLNLYAVEESEDCGLRFVWSLYEPLKALEAVGETFPMPRVAESSAAAAALQGSDLEQTSAHQTTSRGARALQRALKAAAHLPSDVRAMLAATPPERVMEFGIYLHPEETYTPGAWVRGGMVLLGDAAHVSRPSGQGANLAFEDAVVLGAMVRRHGLGQQALHAWERNQMERVRAILLGKDPVQRFAVINEASFEPLWHPADLAAAPGGPLPEEVAAEVRRVLEEEGAGGVDKAREMLYEWSRSVIRSIVEAKVAGRAQHQTIEAPPGTWRGF